MNAQIAGKIFLAVSVRLGSMVGHYETLISELCTIDCPPQDGWALFNPPEETESSLSEEEHTCCLST